MHITRDNNDNVTLPIELIIKFFENHSSNCKIKEHCSNNQATMPSLSLTTPEDIKKLLGAKNSNKAVRFDNIPFKLVKLDLETLATPLLHAVNNSILKGVFQSQAKIVVVSSLDKVSSDENSILNYRPFGILTTFSKIYDHVIKDYLISSMNRYFSPYLTAYRI